MSDPVVGLLGRRIAKFRKAAGLTQEQLGDRLDVALETVSRMERGVSMPSIRTLGKISNALGVPIHVFFVPEGGRSEKDHALDELATVLLRREIEDIHLAAEVVNFLFRHLDRRTQKRRRPKRAGRPEPSSTSSE